jgi:hypothetical protein
VTIRLNLRLHPRLLNTIKTSQKIKYGLTRPIKNLFQITSHFEEKKLKKYHMNYMFKRTYDLQVRKKEKNDHDCEGYEA